MTSNIIIQSVELAVQVIWLLLYEELLVLNTTHFIIPKD